MLGFPDVKIKSSGAESFRLLVLSNFHFFSPRVAASSWEKGPREMTGDEKQIIFF